MNIENISVRELSAYIQDDHYLIIDLRDYWEYSKAHVIHAIQMEPYDIISGNLDRITKSGVILYCSRGGESVRMAKILADKGYHVKNVIGGFREIKENPELIDWKS